ncbi:hypothetical protein C8A00DRAFT_43183 [Chaetomidium leptoderma]|uniref:Zn(2)-C6 fungal-type domain-containing protein n=1 Tax=Chaetomidium leptoderma TaxID=669021 RepID=A0AAN6VLY2_9PEZI|nr:hypothetical protein C8A00DRAFT_43183 [Chaetomidium leptoderma]
MTATAFSGGKRRSRSEGESDRADSEHASSPAPSSRSSTKQQVRHRASIACASCRERRIRCVVSEGESECAQCRRTGATCIIKDDDERRRPISKAYMSSLSSRIALLEGMLKEHGVAPPTAVHPPKTRQEAQARQQQEHHQVQPGNETLDSSEPKLAPLPPNQPPTPPGSGDEDVHMVEPEQPKTFPSAGHTSFTRLIDPLLLQDVEPKKETGTRHLLCTRGSYIFDQSVGRTRFFGPTANSHVHAKSTCSLLPQEEQPDHTVRAEHLIGALGPVTHDHLMRSFWDCYNSWQQVVEEAAFEAGRATQDARFYSPFLHIAMLAMGFRFADWDREDVKRITVGNRESTLHREAKSMLEAELERPGGVPSVQALLLLADLECGVGRDTTGWMYSGMANRLSFDIGLHLERQTRRQAMAACVMFDRKWALLLGRPTAIKTQDIGADVLPRFPGKPLPDSTLGTTFELLELAGKVADFQNSIDGAAHLFSTKGAEDRAYLHFIGLERLFHNWYRRLPENLTWKPVNIKSAPMGFFMLHQQPWAKYGPMSLDGAVAARYPSPESPGREDGTGRLPSWMAPLPHHDNRASMSRSMCTQHAIRIARIFWHHRQRFDARRVVLTAVQHAGTAALALMAALAHKSAELDHHSNLRYLQVLSSSIYDMSHLYQPGARMYQLLKTMLVEIRSEMVKSGGFDVSTLVGRYQGSSSSSNLVFGSNHWATGTGSTRLPTDRLESIQEEDRATKRRRLSSLSSVDLSCVTPSFLSNLHQTCPSPSGSSLSHGTVSTVTLDQPTAEPSTFDLDFFHSSFVDFIHNGGDDAGTQDWAPTAPPQRNAENAAPILIPTVSGDLSCLSTGGGVDSAAAPKTNEPTTTTTTTVSPPTVPTPTPTPAPVDVNVDDDTSVDKTIEDWLAEPSKATPPETTTTTTNPQQQQQQPSPTTAATPPTPSAMHNGNLTHVTADGTPICRDPYVLSLETELGIGFGLGPDHHHPTTSSSSSSSASASASASSSRSMDMEMEMDPMDWFTAAAAGTSPASQSQAPPPPMTPVTLDELVLSVEEAVGSARARARAKAGGGYGGSGVGGNGNGDLREDVINQASRFKAIKAYPKM